MTMTSLDRHRKYAPLFDTDPMTGASIEVFSADGLVRQGWRWMVLVAAPGRFCAGKATGPFPSSYSAYRHAMISGQPPWP